MSIQETSRLTGIAESELCGYRQKGFIGKIGSDELDEQDIKLLGDIRTLEKYDMPDEQLKNYVFSMRQKNYIAASETLRTFRRFLKERVRDEQNALDILDYLINKSESKK